MASKQVNDDLKRGEDFSAAMETHAERVGASAAKALAGKKSDGAPSAHELGALLLFAGKQVHRAGLALRASDDALTVERGDDQAAYDERDEALSDARDELVAVREVITTNCGPAVVKKLGLNGNTPEDPTALVAAMTLLHDSVHAAPPKSVKKGVQFDAKKAAADLPAKAERLTKAIARVRKEKKEEAAALVARDRDWAAFARTFLGCATTARGVFILGGEPELAESLFPSPRDEQSQAAPSDEGGSGKGNDDGPAK